MLWSRLLPKPRHFRILSQSAHQLSASKPHHHISTPPFLRRALSTNHNNNNSNNNSNNNDKFWNLSEDPERRFDTLFVDDGDGEEASAAAAPRGLSGIADGEEESWAEQKQGGRRGPGGGGVDFFESIDKEIAQSSGDGLWSTTTAKVYKPWNMKDDDDSQELQEGDLFNLGERAGDADDDAGGGMSSGLSGVDETRSSEDKAALEREEKELTAILKGPDRAFGDLIAASGITDAMLDSLIALKDFEGLDGLPPLSEIEGIRYQKNTKKSVRAELERQKQEEIAKARVREVDDKGRAYGTGKRKSSIARVWIQPGDGKFVVNDKQFDVYFPMLDHRASLLRPFSETKTLGCWDVSCTVKGGGVSGQVGAIQLGIGRALQNWEPDLRPPLRDAGFLTRDSRVVERKKPGKAKARRSFQWVKR